ncbi:MAG TPA: DUF4038 domain-containing protein [Verrucomicrobiae bacterium]|nr:DUF4038 domain-containing protein [Verrucomicrobiae bacterium]
MRISVKLRIEYWLLPVAASLLFSRAFESSLNAAPAKVSFSQSTDALEAYDFLEITARVEGPDAANPFLDASLSGVFSEAGGNNPYQVDGFCDSDDGSVFRIRFMPSKPGDYTCSLTYRQGGFEAKYEGKFKASASHRRGPIRTDPKYPWHFIWEGTGEHYFFNGTTAFWLMGWREERTINYSIDRLRDLKINRLRVLLAGAANILWGEPVMTGENFTLFLRPWKAEAPQSFDHPRIDFTRFNIPYWQKWERMLYYSRDRDMIISVILDISTHPAQAAKDSEDERRYIRYAVARLGAFSNITWDLGDDLDSFRDEKWAHETGTQLVQWDPYKHLASSHPVNRVHQDRASDWFGFTSIQDWSRSQHSLMLEERQIQLKTGRIIPQTNEEYGYEDHYPHWAPKPDGDSAETLRRIAWDIAMAGAYGTAGESARRGVNIWPDTGGGWINGRGDDTMVMLKGYEHMVDFFTNFDWWKTEPHDELVNNGAYCLAKPGELYAIYLPKEGDVTVKLEPARYEASWFSAFTGERVPLPELKGGEWTSPKTPGWLDWALLLKRKN